MKNLKHKAATIGAVGLIGTVFIGCGAFVHNEYTKWKAETQSINERMLTLEESQRVSNENIRAVAVSTASDLHVIKAILVHDRKKVKYTDKDIQCMAKNIYHEAGIESRKGKIAVGQVTLNRLATKRWGETICDVVYAKSQFSWTLDRKKVKEKPEGELWEESKLAATRVLKGERVKALATSLYYHTNYINTPNWADRKAKLMQIDQHIFYRQAKLEEKKCVQTKHKKCSNKIRPTRGA